METYEGFYGNNYVSHFARSGVDAISALCAHGFMDSDAVVGDRLGSADAACHPGAQAAAHHHGARRVRAFDIRQRAGHQGAARLRAPTSSRSTARQRHFIVEGTGGPSWYTEYNVLAGLSARSFGRFAYFVTRIAAGRVERGLPHGAAPLRLSDLSRSIRRIGAFMSAGSFQKTMGIQNFCDAKAMGATELEPDRFYYDVAAKHHRARARQWIRCSCSSILPPTISPGTTAGAPS